MCPWNCEHQGHYCSKQRTQNSEHDCGSGWNSCHLSIQLLKLSWYTWNLPTRGCSSIKFLTTQLSHVKASTISEANNSGCDGLCICNGHSKILEILHKLNSSLCGLFLLMYSMHTHSPFLLLKHLWFHQPSCFKKKGIAFINGRLHDHVAIYCNKLILDLWCQISCIFGWMENVRFKIRTIIYLLNKSSTREKFPSSLLVPLFKLLPLNPNSCLTTN